MYDRYVGRHLDKTANNSDKVCALRDSYRHSLRWVFEQFVINTSHRPTRSFQIYTGPPTKDFTPDGAQRAINALDRFAEELNQTYGLKPEIYVKIEMEAWGFEHDRYIFTDQMELQVGQGFDLLGIDDQLATTMITRIGDGHRLEVWPKTSSLYNSLWSLARSLHKRLWQAGLFGCTSRG